MCKQTSHFLVKQFNTNQHVRHEIYVIDMVYEKKIESNEIAIRLTDTSDM